MERVGHSSKLVAGIPNRLLSPRKISRELGGREGRFSARTKDGTAQRTNLQPYGISFPGQPLMKWPVYL